MPEAPFHPVTTVPAAPRRRLPLAVLLALGWIGLTLTVAALADVIMPFSITQLDLSNRL